jgi:type IV secretory pathway VirD2 relaxase
LQESHESADEILGVAAFMADIRAELINNRVDAKDRQAQLQNKVILPLQRAAADLFPEFDRRLEKMQEVAGDSAAPAASQAAVDQANAIIAACNAVLEEMLDLETYNELVDLVRSLIEEQEQITSETKKRQAADLLK